MNNESTTESPLLTLLLLDDEQDIINSLKRLLRKDYLIVTFNEGQEALNYLADNHVDIIMSDMRMPNMDGAEFLARSRDIHPNAIRLLLTGYSDMESTIKAINEGGVYTYIGKPWENQELKLTLSKAADHYLLEKKATLLNEQLLQANDELEQFNQSLEQKVAQRTQALQTSKQKLQTALGTQKDLLHDVLDMMTATIEYRTGLGAGHVKRIAIQCRALAQQLNLSDTLCQRVYLCALLHEIGTVGLADDILEASQLGANNIDEALKTHPEIGATIVSRVKRFSVLVENIRHQNENVDGTGLPDHLSGEDIPIGARIIRVVKDFDYLIAGKKNNHKLSIKDAESWIRERSGVWYDKQVISAFLQILTKRDLDIDGMEYSVGIESLKVGNTVLEDLVLHNGNVMLTAGQEINETMIEKLREYEENYNTKVTLFVA